MDSDPSGGWVDSVERSEISRSMPWPRCAQQTRLRMLAAAPPPPVSRQELSRNATVDRKFRPKLQLHLDSRSDFEEVLDLVDVHLVGPAKRQQAATCSVYPNP